MADKNSVYKIYLVQEKLEVNGGQKGSKYRYAIFKDCINPIDIPARKDTRQMMAL